MLFDHLKRNKLLYVFRYSRFTVIVTNIITHRINETFNNRKKNFLKAITLDI